jgi:mono/diheme cytochrome c family protein
MTTLIFVLVWVVLALGLLLIAFSGGPSGAGQQLMSQSRGARKAAIVLFSLLALALGVLVPAAVIAAVSNRDDIPEANVTGLTASEKNGRELFGRRCANCHTLEAANAIASIGPNLDQLRPNKELVLNAIENGRARGNGQMAAGLYTGEDAEDVANFVAKAVGQTEQSGGGGEGESGGGEGESGGGEGEGGGGEGESGAASSSG